jgi:TRAP-type C4-dicarboxylate transport system permease small subunit
MQKICDGMHWFLTRLSGVLFAGVFAVTVLNISLRNLGGVTWLWIPGVSRLLFIWTIFMGTAVLYERKDHLIMDFFVNKLAPEKQARLQLAINSVFLAFLVLFVIYGLNIAKVRMHISFETWKFPTGVAYLAAPVSGSIMILFCINKIRRFLKGQRDE